MIENIKKITLSLVYSFGCLFCLWLGIGLALNGLMIGTLGLGCDPDGALFKSFAVVAYYFPGDEVFTQLTTSFLTSKVPFTALGQLLLQFVFYALITGIVSLLSLYAAYRFFSEFRSIWR